RQARIPDRRTHPAGHPDNPGRNGRWRPCSWRRRRYSAAPEIPPKDGRNRRRSGCYRDQKSKVSWVLLGAGGGPRAPASKTPRSLAEPLYGGSRLIGLARTRFNGGMMALPCLSGSRAPLKTLRTAPRDWTMTGIIDEQGYRLNVGI